MSKGALVVMKAIKKGNIYKMDRSAQIRKVTIAYEEADKFSFLRHH